MTWIVLSTALAGPMIAEVGADLDLGISGTWARAVPKDDGGWHFLFGGGGEYQRVAMNAALDVEDRGRVGMTGRSDLQDYNLVPCADGTWLLVASGSQERPNDSLFAFRYDAGLALLASGTLLSGGGSYNDPVALCAAGEGGPDVAGAGMTTAVFVEVGADAQPDRREDVFSHPQVMGGSLVWEPERAVLWQLSGPSGGDVIERHQLYEGFADGEDEAALPVPPDGESHYWPQSVLRVGDWYVVAYMSRDAAEGWNGDVGNVWIAVLDLDWNLADAAQLTDWAAPDGGMRPTLARRDDQLLVFYDRLVAMRVVPVTLDLVAFGLAEPGSVDTGGPADTGEPPVAVDTGEPPAAGDSGSDPAEIDKDDALPARRSCGCVTSGRSGMGAPLLVALLALARRRGS